MRSALLLFVVAVALPLAAQSPKITPGGDPSINSDTIYHLDPQAGNAPYVLLLDDGIVRFEADGRGSRTYRQVVYINKQTAVEQYAERRFTYTPAHEKLTINWTKVVRPDGTVLSDQPALSQDADVPVESSNPVYVERKVKRLSLAKVAPGTIVDVSYTVEENEPSRIGDFYASWNVHSSQAVRRSRYILDLPASLQPTIKETNLPFKRVDVVSKGRRVLTWATADVPRIEGEPFASDSNGVFQIITVVGPGTWADIGSWYARLAKDRAVLDANGNRLIDSIVRGSASRDDSIRAVHRWIAQDIRYVSVALGIGSYQPRLPSAVIASGFGDCKDKATLFVASMAHLGITAYPVLLSSYGRADATLPTIRQFNHMIAAVPMADGALRYADLTADIVQYGTIPYGEQGGFAVLVKPDGNIRELTLPRDSIEANTATFNFTGVLAPDGEVSGRISQEFRGATQYPLRAGLMTKPDSTVRAQMANALAGAVFPGATGEGLELFDGKDLSAEPRIAVTLTHGQAARLTGTSAILTVPGGASSRVLNIVKTLEKAPTRKFPIDASQVGGTIGATADIHYTLPAGWKAHLPADVHAISRFGRYEATYSQSGTELTVQRRVLGARGIFPSDSLGELITWLKQTAAADAEFIILDVPGA